MIFKNFDFKFKMMKSTPSVRLILLDCLFAKKNFAGWNPDGWYPYGSEVTRKVKCCIPVNQYVNQKLSG